MDVASATHLTLRAANIVACDPSVVVGWKEGAPFTLGLQELSSIGP